MKEWVARGMYEYHVSTEPEPHPIAQQICRDLDGDLTSILSEEEEQFLTQDLNFNSWPR